VHLLQFGEILVDARDAGQGPQTMHVQVVRLEPGITFAGTYHRHSLGWPDPAGTSNHPGGDEAPSLTCVSPGAGRRHTTVIVQVIDSSRNESDN